MRNKIASLLILFFCLIFVNNVYSQDTPEVRNCLKMQSLGRCDTYLTNVKTCLEKIPLTDFAWNCSETDDFGQLNQNNIRRCSTTFSNFVCNNLEGISNVAGVFSRSCQNVCNNTGNTHLGDLNLLAENKINGRDRATPTPTPTLPVDSVDALDPCINLIDNTKGCFDNLNALDACYDGLNPGHGVWSCIGSDGEELDEQICEDAFIRRIQSSFIQKTGQSCNDRYVSPRTNEEKSNGSLRIGFKTQRSYRTSGSNAPFADPVTTPTPGIVYDAQNPEILDKYEELLNCGFADNSSKNRCCPTDIDISGLSSEMNIGELEGNQCLIPFVSESICPSWASSNGLRDKVVQLATSDFQTKLDGLQTLSDEDGGQIRECYVGKCEVVGADRVCVGEGGLAACARYITGDSNKDAFAACAKCMGDNEGANKSKKVYTALGCINTSFDGFISDVFSLGIGIAGLTALFCIIYAAFTLQTSQGNPEQIQKAQENLTSCISGLILIIFSVLFLRIIGGDLLRIPGFTNEIDTSVNQSNNTPTIAAQQKLQPTTIATVNPTITSVPISTITQIPTATTTPIATPQPIGTVTGTIRAGSTLYFSNDTVNPSLTVEFPNAQFVYQTNDNLYLYSDTMNAWVARASVDLTNEGQLFQVVEVEYPSYLTSNIAN